MVVNIKEQNMLWECMPDDVKESIIQIYEENDAIATGDYLEDDIYEASSKCQSLERAFGRHNLVLWKKYM